MSGNKIWVQDSSGEDRHYYVRESDYNEFVQEEGPNGDFPSDFEGSIQGKAWYDESQNTSLHYKGKPRGVDTKRFGTLAEAKNYVEVNQ